MLASHLDGPGLRFLVGSGTRADFLSVVWFPLPVLIPLTTLYTSVTLLLMPYIHNTDNVAN
jgi:hypothetical protein